MSTAPMPPSETRCPACSCRAGIVNSYESTYWCKGCGAYISVEHDDYIQTTLFEGQRKILLVAAAGWLLAATLACARLYELVTR